MTTQKITLHSPPDGYESEAEIRWAKQGEHYLETGKVRIATIDHIAESIILTPKRQRAEVRRYWATYGGKRIQFTKWEGWGNFHNPVMGWMSVTSLKDIKEIDPEFIDAPPVPEKDWWYWREKMPDKWNAAAVLVWDGSWWVCKRFSVVSGDTIWRYQPPAPSVETTDAQFGAGGEK